MIDKDLDKITKVDLDWLIENKYHERKTIDYKRELPGRSDGERKEFLYDVASFANADGGDLVYGVIEENSYPKSYVRIETTNIDEEKRRLSQLIDSSIKPRIPRYDIKPIEIKDDEYLLIVRIFKSWLAPHMVTYQKASKFYARSSAGKYEMDYKEIKDTFNYSSTILDRMRNYLRERLDKIMADDTPVKLIDEPKLIMHVLPFESFGTSMQLNFSDYRQWMHELIPFDYQGYSHRFNFDGFLLVGNYPSDNNMYPWYTQLSRSGQIELARIKLVHYRESYKLISSIYSEKGIIKTLNQYLKLLKKCQIACPIIISIALLNVKGSYLWIKDDYRVSIEYERIIDRDNLILPEIILEDYPVSLEKELKPAFDALWNASGYERCLDYDEAGEWIPNKD